MSRRAVSFTVCYCISNLYLPLLCEDSTQHILLFGNNRLSHNTVDISFNVELHVSDYAMTGPWYDYIWFRDIVSFVNVDTKKQKRITKHSQL